MEVVSHVTLGKNEYFSKYQTITLSFLEQDTQTQSAPNVYVCKL